MLELHCMRPVRESCLCLCLLYVLIKSIQPRYVKLLLLSPQCGASEPWVHAEGSNAVNKTLAAVYTSHIWILVPPKALGSLQSNWATHPFSAGLQIKQSCLAKQNPLQSYFPPSVRPGKNTRKPFQPWGLSRSETLDQSDWWKGPINTLSRPFLKSTSSVGVNEKLHLTLRLSQQECRLPTLCEKPPWTENICVFYFSPVLESDTFHPFWQRPEFPHYFKTFWVTCQIFSFTLVLCSPVAKISRSRPAALCGPVVFFNISNRGVSAQCGCSSRLLGASWRDCTWLSSFKGVYKTPKPSCLDENPTPAGLCETSQHRKATDYGLLCHTSVLPNHPSTLRGSSPATKIWSFKSLTWKKLNICTEKNLYPAYF